MLAETAYGKSSVRLVKVSRHGDRHDLTDLTVAIRFEGEFDESYTQGDNRDVLPTDTMKNTVYAMVRVTRSTSPRRSAGCSRNIFSNAIRNCGVFESTSPNSSGGESPSARGSNGQAFVRHGPESRSATVRGEGDNIVVGAGVKDLVILKSSHPGFAGFLRDEYTTLPDVADRILATAMTATWKYRTADIDFNLTWRAVRTTLLEARGSR